MKRFVEFYVGMNAEENFELIDMASPNDLWFHVNNRSSGHVVAKIPENTSRKEISAIVKQGAFVCKYYSKYSSEQNLEIIYTKIENVKKTEIVGKVELSNHKIAFC
jgi:predicted ribosome quality control (RQC) complex YloA/Tae2 family protein